MLENRLLKKSVTGFDSEAVPDPCVAPWDVAIGTNRGGEWARDHGLARREVEPLHRRNICLFGG